MFDQLKRMATLVTVVEQGSFGAAARALGTTTSAVSQQVRALEQSLGLPLLARTTRQVRLTTAGASFHRECVAMVEAARRAEQALQTLKDAPTGELRMTAPAGFTPHLARGLAPMLHRYPDLKLHLLADDALSDLVAERMDLALRFGRLPDSNWVARKLGNLAMVLCAAPAYLARCGLPTDPSATGHQLVALDTGTQAPPLVLRGEGGAAHTLEWPVRVSGNTLSWVQQMCEAGLGVAMLSEWDAREALAEGRLLRVLPDWHAPVLDVYAVMQPRSARTAKMRVLLDALAGLMTQSDHV